MCPRHIQTMLETAHSGHQPAAFMGVPRQSSAARSGRRSHWIPRKDAEHMRPARGVCWSLCDMSCHGPASLPGVSIKVMVCAFPVTAPFVSPPLDASGNLSFARGASMPLQPNTSQFCQGPARTSSGRGTQAAARTAAVRVQAAPPTTTAPILAKTCRHASVGTAIAAMPCTA